MSPNPLSGRSFDSLGELTLHTPVVTSARTDQVGLPVLFDSDSGQPLPFDPYALKEQGRIGTTALGILGKRNHGKTTTNMHLASTFSLLRRGYGDRPYRVTGDDLRRTDGVPEYKEFVQMMGGVHVPLAQYQLNVLDPKMNMTFEQQLGMIKVLLEHAFRAPLSPAYAEALRYALKLARFEAGDKLEFGLIPKYLRRLEEADIEVLLRQSDEEVLPRVSFKAVVTNRLGRSPKILPDLLWDAVRLAGMIEELIDGEFGSVFGGLQSLSGVLENDTVVFDYSGLGEETTVLIQAMMWYWKAAAIQNGNSSFRFDMEFHDENYRMWKYLVYAEAMHQYLKQLRSHATFVVLDTHRIADYQSVGAVGSRVYELATGALRDIDMFLLGKHDQQSAHETGEFLGLSGREVELIQNLRRGHWALAIRGEPCVFVHTIPSADILRVSQTNKANERMF